jgi:NAD(P)-dependent dehydrogenase (short-subunit alcohol dehydrogenase family)
MSAELTGHVALVTGASRGIGRAIAEHLAAAGMKVLLCARSSEELGAVARAIADAGGEAALSVTDVLDFADVQQAVDLALDRWGRLDLVVNNAGSLAAIGPTWQTDPREWGQDVTVNVLGVYHGCRAAIPVMIRQGAGRVVNLVGGGVHTPFPNASAYATSKTAVMRLTENLQVELASEGEPVRVFAMTPGLIRTRMTAQFVETERGRRWMDHTGSRLREGKDVTPEAACTLVAALAGGDLDSLAGRFLSAPQDAADLDGLRAEGARLAQGSDDRLLRILGR